jgi:Poly(ADP-ribose) polymerase catalytic domain
MSGITMKMIASRLAEDQVTITHAELVLNPSLVQAFDSTHTRLKRKYSKSYHYDKYTSMELVFHGTRRQDIANIIARGFIKPGDVMNHKGDTLEVRCGSSFGRGTYTSPDPRYAMHYSDYTSRERRNDFKIPGQKIIVCAALLGRRFRCEFGERRGVDIVEKGYESHVSGTGFEFVVFNSAQLLPLYVLHLADGKENLSSFWAQRVARGPPLEWTIDVLAERKRTNIDEIDASETDLTLAMKRKIMTKLARKHFPFGYGPAEGTKFVVEEIGEVDEDDEEWGEYQLDRNQYERDGEGIKYDSCTMTGYGPELAEGFIKKDEFQAARFKNYN